MEVRSRTAQWSGQLTAKAPASATARTSSHVEWGLPPSLCERPTDGSNAMTFIQTIPPEEATGDLKELYERDLAHLGYVANYTRAMSLRPEVIAAYRALHGVIRANLEPRRYELVTVAAAAHLRSSYCMLAHGAALRTQFFGPEQVEAIAHDYRSAGLDATEVAI